MQKNFNPSHQSRRPPQPLRCLPTADPAPPQPLRRLPLLYRTRGMTVKRLHVVVEEEEDRLSNMPESLQLRVLSFLDARHAIGTSAISRSWVSLWTCAPVLNFSSDGFKHLLVFDNFILNVLSRRQPVKLDRLTFKRDGRCFAEMLKKVFDYASSHGVKELEVSIVYMIDDHNIRMWPIWSSDSLTSLKFETQYVVSYSFLEPRSPGSFKNLTNLHLTYVVIRDLDPFSGFPALEKLKLVGCCLNTNGKALNVHALQLSEFTFSYTSQDVGQCEFRTPKLRYFEWSGSGFPRLKAHLPVLDTVVIDYNGYCRKEQEKIVFDDLLMVLDTLHTAKSLTLSARTVRLLASFPMNGCSPFRDLKCLKLDFWAPLYIEWKLFLSETLELVPGVKAYLLNKSNDAKCTILNHLNAESSSSRPQKSMCDTTPRQAGEPTQTHG